MSDDLNPLDRDAMIRTVMSEQAGNQGAEGQAAVAQSIMNRVVSGRYGNSPAAVVLAPGQYEPWQTRRQELLSYSPNSPAYQKVGGIVDAVAAGDIPDATNGSTHFLQKETVLQRRGSLPGWASKPVARVGAHTFYAPEGKSSASDAIDAINDAVGTPPGPTGALAFSTAIPNAVGNQGSTSSPGDMFRSAGFAGSPGDKKTAPLVGDAPVSPSGPGSMFQAAGFVAPGSPQAPQTPALAGSGSASQSGSARSPKSRCTDRTRARHLASDQGDFLANIPHALLETVEAPGNVLALKTPSTSESLIPSAVGLAGLTYGGELPRTTAATVAAKASSICAGRQQAGRCDRPRERTGCGRSGCRPILAWR